MREEFYFIVITFPLSDVDGLLPAAPLFLNKCFVIHKVFVYGVFISVPYFNDSNSLIQHCGLLTCGFRMTFSALIVFLMYVGLFFSFFQDLGLAQNTATNTKTPVPLGSLAHQVYRMMCARGYGNKDFSSVFQFLREEEGQ